jgi:ketosteroid isomerase-like protein
MSKRNVELVRHVYDAGARRDSEAVLAAHSPEVVWDISHAPARDLMAGTNIYVGHEGLRTFFREWYEAWENVEADYEALIDAGDVVVSIETTRARGRRSGAQVELKHAAVWEIRDGKVDRVTWFGSRAEALEAAGQRK